jgi:carbon-monoxide dehydrogenase medium subunit
MKTPKFAYIRAESVAQVLNLLAEHGDDARILAGGQSLMPTLNMRLSQPDLLIDINRLDVLKGISVEDGPKDGMVRIGALVRHAEVARSPIVAEHLPLIAEAMPHIAHMAVRNRGTFGGSIALADPAAELPACVLALGATMVVESTRGRRKIAAAEFFKGIFDTDRKPDELLIEIRIPCREPNNFSAFMELSRRQGDFAIAGLACQISIDGDAISAAQLVYFASEVRPTFAANASAAIIGKPWSAESKSAALAALADDLDPIPSLQGSAKFKLHLQRVLTGRALDQVIERAMEPAGAA